jgi:hypothetical protein
MPKTGTSQDHELIKKNNMKIQQNVNNQPGTVGNTTFFVM